MMPEAIVAAARRLVVLFWGTLTRGQDYAHQQPSLTGQKLRRREIAAGAPVREGKPSACRSPTRNAPCRKGARRPDACS